VGWGGQVGVGGWQRQGRRGRARRVRGHAGWGMQGGRAREVAAPRQPPAARQLTLGQQDVARGAGREQRPALVACGGAGARQARSGRQAGLGHGSRNRRSGAWRPRPVQQVWRARGEGLQGSGWGVAGGSTPLLPAAAYPSAARSRRWWPEGPRAGRCRCAPAR
jgi:hypothetical protein